MSNKNDGKGMTIITISINIATGSPKGFILSGSEIGPPNVFSYKNVYISITYNINFPYLDRSKNNANIFLFNFH